MTLDDLGTPMPVEFSVQPFEAGKVLYLRVGSAKSGEQPTAMLYFMLKLVNKSGKTLTLKSIDVAFPGSQVASRSFARDIAIEPGSASVWLTGEEEIELPTVPPTIKVSLSFDELADPVGQTWPLARHTKSYDFFCRPEPGSDFGEYIVLPGQHYKGGGGQHFGYDAYAAGWTTKGLSSSRTDGKTNADRFTWNRPVYSMADGVVIQAIDHHADNPAPDKRGFARLKGEFVGETQITAVSAASIAPEDQEWSRFVVGVVSGTKVVQLMLFAQTQDGGQLQQLCTAKGGSAERISVVGIDRHRVVTLTQIGSKAELTMWKVAADGLSIAPVNNVAIAGAVSGRVSKLSGSLLVTATRTGTGKVDLTLWRIEDGKLVVTPAGHAVSQSGTGYDLQAVDSDRFALGTRTAQGNLRLENWELVGGEGGGGSGQDDFQTIGMQLAGAGSGGAVSEIALCKNATGQVTTAVRTGGGKLKVIVWEVPVEADPIRWAEEEYTTAVSTVDVSLFHKTALGVGSLTDGKLRLLAIVPQEDDDTKARTLVHHHELTLGAADLIALTQVPTNTKTLVSAVRTGTGTLKVSLWQYTGNNIVRILYGNEIVQFVHLRQNSIPDALNSDVPVPVKRGQLIGRIGNAGSSGGPHLHLDAIRVRSDLLSDVPGLMKRVRAGETVGDFRPLQFRGVLAMQNKGVVQGGAAKNPLVPWDGHGAYFRSFVVLPLT
jgi:hypothetical protein